MVGLSLERRLRAVEDRLGIQSGVEGLTPQERAHRAVMDGSASPEDFRAYLRPVLAVIQAHIVVRSAYFREARDAGQDPWAWWPLDIASKLAAVPLGEVPDPRLGNHLVELASLRIHQPGTTSLKPGQWQVAWSLWAGASMMLVALGGPDGRRLRHQVAEGMFDDAAAVVRAAGLRLPTADGLARRCPAR